MVDSTRWLNAMHRGLVPLQHEGIAYVLIALLTSHSGVNIVLMSLEPGPGSKASMTLVALEGRAVFMF